MQPDLLLDPNFFALQKQLALPRYAVVGLLHTLWQIAAQHAPSGNLSQFTPAAIALALDWDKNPDDLITALVATRWLDQSPTGELSIHNWLQYAPARIRNKLKREQMGTAKESSTSATTAPAWLGSSNASPQLNPPAASAEQAINLITESTAPTNRPTQASDGRQSVVSSLPSISIAQTPAIAQTPGSLTTPQTTENSRLPFTKPNPATLKALANNLDPESIAGMRNFLQRLHTASERLTPPVTQPH